MENKNEIPELEKSIYQQLDFPNEYLRIRLKYKKEQNVNSYIKLGDVKRILKELGLEYKYIGENCHQIVLMKYHSYTFKLNFIVKGDWVDSRYYILKNDIYIAPKEASLSYLLNFIPFDKHLLNPSFGFNSESELKDYVFDIINLCNKFTNRYIEEIEAGNLPE